MTDTTKSAEPLLAVSELRKSFRKDGQEIQVLDGVNLQVHRGESIAIMGRSGAGKTTFLQVIGTLDRPTSGRVTFEGHSVFDWKEAQLAQYRGRTIGFVFQFHHLLPEFTALENAALPAMIARVPKNEAMELARVHLERVGMSHRLTHKPGELSGGEQQRVALARALVMKPRLLLADEPTGNLDDRTGAAVVDLFRELTRELGVAVIVVTHNRGLAERMGRTLIMDGGRLLDDDHLSNNAGTN